MSTESTTQLQAPPDSTKTVLGLIILLIVVSSGMLVGGEAGSFMTASMQVVPFVVLAVLAYLAPHHLWAKVATLVWLGIVLIGIALFSLMWGVIGLLDPTTIDALSGDSPAMRPRLLPGSVPLLLLVVGGLLLAGGVGVMGFVPPVRRWLSRVVPLNPDSFIHTIALVTVVAGSLMACVPLVVLGAPPMLSEASLAMLGPSLEAELAASLRFETYVLIWTIAGSLFAVGFGVQRTMHDTLLRLGFVRPTLRQLLIGLVAAPLLVGVMLVFGEVVEWLWGHMRWSLTDEESLEVLFLSSLTPVGALVGAVSAGVGEELAVRGVLQPRVGIVFSNVFFASLHAWQYNWDGVVGVFLIGLVFALIRKRTNTTTSAISHGVYDLILFVAIMLGY